jgi:peptidylprolyl isomerase
VNKSLYIPIIGLVIFFAIVTAYFMFQTVSQTQTERSYSELKIEDIKVGEGRAVVAGDTVSINYRGKLVNGTEFDSSYKRGQPFETAIGLGKVIKGWDQGIPGMKVGGKRKLIIPSNLAYGKNGHPPVIPPDAPLIFEVELVGIR